MKRLRFHVKRKKGHGLGLGLAVLPSDRPNALLLESSTQLSHQKCNSCVIGPSLFASGFSSNDKEQLIFLVGFQKCLPTHRSAGQTDMKGGDLLSGGPNISVSHSSYSRLLQICCPLWCLCQGTSPSLTMSDNPTSSFNQQRQTTSVLLYISSIQILFYIIESNP